MITWLIDMGYITKASKGRFKLDYIVGRKFIEETLEDQCQATIFNSIDEHYGVERGLRQFYHTVEQAGFTVNLYPMEGDSQRQVDVAIASYAVWQASKGDNIILSSGDIDFLPAARLITEKTQCKFILFTYDFGVHQEMIKIASDHWLFEDYPQLKRS